MKHAGLEVNRTYEEQRDYVLAVLRRRAGWLAADEREALFHDAYAVLLEKEREGELETAAMHGNQLRAYLTQTALFKALDEGKRAERNRSAPLEDAGDVEEDETPSLEDSISAEMEGARVREIVAELPRRRQAIVKLRFFFERTPAEIQELLGVSSRVYRRELERAVKQIADRYELVRSGHFCESKRSLLLAYVAGVAGPGRAREARAHLETCPGCSAWALEMRETTRRTAALLPLPALTGLGPRLGEWLSAVREQIASLLTGAKHQAASLASRVDPGAGGYAVGARPSAVAATVAGCLALGGGAYCAVEGVPDAFFGSTPTIRLDEGAKRKPQPKRVVRPLTEVPSAEPAVRMEPPPATTTRAVVKRHTEQKREAAPVAAASNLEKEAAAAEEEFSPVPSAEAPTEYAEPEASSASGYPAPSNAAPPPEETAGSEAEFAP